MISIMSLPQLSLLLLFFLPFSLSFDPPYHPPPAEEYGWPYKESFSSPKDFKIYVYPYRPTYEERIEHMKNPVNEKFHSLSSSSSSHSSLHHTQHHLFFSSATLSAGYPALRNLSQPFDKSLISRPFNFRGQAFGLGVEYRIASAIIGSGYVTNDPEEADLFFVHYAPHRGEHKEDGRVVMKMLEESPYYHPEISNHFFIHNLPWFSLWTPSPPPTLLSISPEEFKSKPFQNIIVPYTDDGWGTDRRTWQWEDIKNKKYLGCFFGSLSRVRQAQEQRRVLREQFRSAGGEFLWKEFGKKTTTYNYSEQMLVLRQCRYCPIPKGDSASSKRLFDAIQADCIPVVLSDEFIFPYESSLNYNDFIYSLPENNLNSKSNFNFVDFVRGISEEEERQKRQKLQENKHHFIFNDPYIYPGDATDLLMKELGYRAGIMRGRKREIQLLVEKKKRGGNRGGKGGGKQQQHHQQFEHRELQKDTRSILDSLRNLGRNT